MESIQSLLPHLEKETILISLMAGISISLIETMVGANMSIGRAMPNTSAASNQSATAISYNRDTTDHQKNTVKEILSTIGIVEETNEDSLDLFTAVSGSGPAYFYYLVEALEEAATQYGMSETTAKQFIIQTLVGAGATMKKTGKPAAQLRKEVTSPGGTTEAGIRALNNHGVKEALQECIMQAYQQSKKLRVETEEKVSQQLKQL
ncbi:pyrroline-5-carboxylate reductase family protein [Bacillus coahuilensis]|uniref:pyrroline-5-carboxylate reductase family protein n=1 Tax=Bacillus coahuilensis TaxID=408580 RepID=UPI000185105A|nr:pyrroline-5-carboxylate reductase [Bacillus coahuilensis]